MELEDFVGRKVRGPDGRVVGRIERIHASCVNGFWRLLSVEVSGGLEIPMQLLDFERPSRPRLKVPPDVLRASSQKIPD